MQNVLRNLLCAVPLLVAAEMPLQAQDYTHPREMGLPESVFRRPDPADLGMTLGNGLTAYVATDQRSPLVSITAYLRLGAVHGTPGAAAALAAALRRGPADHPDFAGELERLNAQYNVVQHREYTRLRMDLLSEDMQQGLDLLARTLLAPAFAGAAPATPNRTASAGIDYAYSMQHAVDLFESALFEGHPYRRKFPGEAEGSGEAEATARATEAMQLHSRYVNAGNLVLAVAGKGQAAQLRRAVSASFQHIAGGGERPAADLPDLPFEDTRRVRLQNTDRNQGWIVIGHAIGEIPEQDEAALHVMDYILGAYHLDTRLYLSSRERRGLTNDNSSFLEPGMQGPGTYSFRSYGRPEAIRLLVQITFDELARMRETLPSEEELFIARGALVDGLYARRYATGLDAVNSLAMEFLQYGNHERSATYPERIAAVSVGDVRAAARRYIRPQSTIVAVLGPLERIARAPALENEVQLDSWGMTLRIDDPAAMHGAAASQSQAGVP